MVLLSEACRQLLLKEKVSLWQYIYGWQKFFFTVLSPMTKTDFFIRFDWLLSRLWLLSLSLPLMLVSCFVLILLLWLLMLVDMFTFSEFVITFSILYSLRSYHKFVLIRQKFLYHLFKFCNYSCLFHFLLPYCSSP